MLVSQNFKNKILNTYNSGDYYNVEQDATLLLSKGFTDPWLCNLLAVSLAKQKKFSQAVKYFEILCDLFPNEFDNYFNLANLFRDAQKPKIAMKYYLQSHKIRPLCVKTIIEISKIFYKNEEFENSLFYAKKAKKIEPNSYKVIDLFGKILFLKGDFEKSLSEYKKISNIDEKRQEVELNIASNLYQLGFLDKSKKILSRLSSEKAAYNLGIINLKEKCFDIGWDRYEIGIELGERKLRVENKTLSILPKWTPNLNFNSILIVGEQGLGDELMFSSLLKNLNLEKYKLGLLLDKRLKNLFRLSDIKHEFITSFDEAIEKKYESYLPIGSLCKYFLKKESDFPRATNFNFAVNKNKKNKFKSLIKNNKITIGLSWYTNNKQLGPKRNIKLKQFAPFFTNVDANFINLQYGDVKAEIDRVSKKINKCLFVDDNIDNKNDIEGLAEKILACDMVVSIDNSTLHLSSLLKKDTVALIPEVSDWRWFNDSTNSLWYPKTYILRKTISWDKEILKLIEICKNKFLI